jgi:hypothetical protein
LRLPSFSTECMGASQIVLRNHGMAKEELSLKFGKRWIFHPLPTSRTC